MLVTGVSGFIGSQLAARLVRRGDEVVALARNPERVRSALQRHRVEVDEIVTGDMTDPAAVATALRDCDAVVHAAAQIGVFAGDGAEREANVAGVEAVVGGAVAAGCERIVYTSTFTVHLPTDDTVIGPATDFAEPLSVYGRSKLACERLVAGWQEDGAPIVTLVLGGVYGPDQPHLGGSAGALLSMIEGMCVAVDGGVPIIDVRDVAAVITGLLKPDAPTGRIMCGGPFVSWREMNDVLDEVTGRDLPRFEIDVDDFVAMGRGLDDRRATGEEIDMPLTEDAAVIMTAGRPTDDTATWDAVGVRPRLTAETLRDAVTWLVRAGHLDPALAPAVT